MDILAQNIQTIKDGYTPKNNDENGQLIDININTKTSSLCSSLSPVWTIRVHINTAASRAMYVHCFCNAPKLTYKERLALSHTLSRFDYKIPLVGDLTNCE